MKPNADLPFSAALPALALLTGVFFLNFLTRILLAPLLPVVEADLGLNHGQSGALFLLLALGNAVGLLLSGLTASRLGHRRTIAVSALCLGGMAVLAGLSEDLLWFRAALFGIGLSAGTYLPSGIASITMLVRRADWGKAVAVHEMAPNGSYFLAPLVAEAALAWTGWREGILLLGLSGMLMGLVFLRLGRTTEAKGSPPSPRVVADLARRGSFWLLAFFFILGVGGAFASYSMLPLYLTDLGWPRSEANHLLALSRVGALAMPFLSGWLVDRVGTRPMLAATFGLNAACLAGLGLASGPLLAGLVVVQPLFSVMFFPPGFAALSALFEPESRSAAVSLITPVSIFAGIGGMPYLIGLLGDAGRFPLGFGLVAGLVFAGMLLVGLLKVKPRT